MLYKTALIFVILPALCSISCGDNLTNEPVPDSCKVEDAEEDCLLGADIAEDPNKPWIHIRTINDLEEICSEPCSSAHQISFNAFKGPEHLTGFNFIQTIQSGLSVSTRGVHTFSAFPNISSVSTVTFDSNTELESIATFHQLETLGFDLELKNNPHLRDLTGFQNLRHTGTKGDESMTGALLELNQLNRLSDLNGFENLKTAYFVKISRNKSLTSLDGLESLEDVESLEITNNENLENINALESLHTIHRFAEFQNLPQLRRCEIEEFIDGLENPPDKVEISGVSDEPCD